jgi:hypothetical protein
MEVLMKLVLVLMLLSGCATKTLNGDVATLIPPEGITKDQNALNHNSCGGNSNRTVSEVYVACMHNLGYKDHIEHHDETVHTFLGFYWGF